jgi:hypothetical protein
MEPGGSLPCSQEHFTGSFPEPHQSNPSHPIPSYLCKIHFNIVHLPSSWSSQWSLSFWLSNQYPICIPLLPHSCYMPCPSHPPWLDHSWRRVQVTKLHIMQFSPISRHFISLRSKYSPQHPVLKHPQSTFFPQYQRPSFTPIQNHRQNYTFVYTRTCEAS